MDVDGLDVMTKKERLPVDMRNETNVGKSSRTRETIELKSHSLLNPQFCLHDKVFAP